MKNALLSVYNKDGLVEFARALTKLGYDLFASGGTATALEGGNLPVTRVGIDILNHRVATLVPEVHSGLLADPTTHQDEMADRGYRFYELVCVDLYPLAAEIEKPEATEASVIEKTDIGGPTMLRAAAKGRRIVISRPALRQPVLNWLAEGKPNEDYVLAALAATAESDVREYCEASANYLRNQAKQKRPAQLHPVSDQLIVHTVAIPPSGGYVPVGI